MSRLIDTERTWRGRYVWEIVYTYQAQVRGGGTAGNMYDDDRVVGYKTTETVMHVIAPELELAKALFAYHHTPATGYALVSCTPLCTINHEIIMEGIPRDR